MVEADKAETKRAKAETARARAEWQAKKKEEAGGQVNPTEEQAVEFPSRLARDTLNKQGSGAQIDGNQVTGVKPAKRGENEEHGKRSEAEGGPANSHAASDEEVVRAAFKINPANTVETEPKEQVEDAPGRKQEAGGDAVLRSQGGAEAGDDEEEEGERWRA
jgi:hypothetical protein